MVQSVGRAYHPMIGWQMKEQSGTFIATMGGYKTMRDPVDNQQISTVYQDTVVSMPQKPNSTQASDWYDVILNSLHSDTIEGRLEHSAVLSRVYGNMIVWGGRFRETMDVSGVWSLNIAGPESSVEFQKGSDESELSDPGMASILLVTVMMTSMMFTYMCGVVHRRMEEDPGLNGDGMNGDPSPLPSVFGRNGLSQDIIDTLPLKKYQNETGDTAEPSNTESTSNSNEASDSMDFSFNDDEDCCQICLVEYEVGDDIRCLPCNHEFHKSCVDPWLAQNASCPACRHSLSDLVSLTTSNDFASQIRATISASLMPQRTEESTETTPNEDVLPRHPSSPPASPDQAIAPGVRGFQSMRRFFNTIRSRSQLQETTSSGDSHDGDIEVVGDLELSYSSSLELSDGNSSQDNSFDSDDVPMEENSRRRPRIINTARQRLMRDQRRQRRRHRRGQRRSALNAPLQPSDGAIV